MSFLNRIKRLLTPKPLTVFQKTRLTLLRIEPASMSKVLSFDMALVRLHTVVTSISKYTKLLDTISGAILDDKQLSPLNLPQSVEEIYLRDFFQDAEGYFIPPVSGIKVFVDSCIRFVDIYEEKERLAEKSFALERNLRLTQRILSNIAVIAEELTIGGRAKE